MSDFYSALIIPLILFLKGLLLDFSFYYPLFMSYLWMTGAIFYYFRFERKYVNQKAPAPLKQYPGVAIVVPCHNEESNIRDTITYAFRQQYPDFEVIAVNDGSTDRTQEILNELQVEYPNLRVIHQVQNQGKANGLNKAALLTSKEYLLCIDGDCVLDEHAISWMVPHFIFSPRVGAVTGNPRIRNRSTLLGKIQVGEFSSIIGLIKRSQRVYGRIFTVSGVIAAFRKTALHDVGYWSTEMLTDDIDVSWKLQLAHWDIRYEPKSVCWILMPETFKGLWNQRLRWAMGGAQTAIKYFSILFVWRKRRMWFVYGEYVVGIVWACSIFIVSVLAVLNLLFPMPGFLYIAPVFYGWNGVLLGLTCMLQIAVSMTIDSKYDVKLWGGYFWMIWYPLVYWIINMLTIVVAIPKTLMRKKTQHAIWVSPDRGLMK